MQPLDDLSERTLRDLLVHLVQERDLGAGGLRRTEPVQLVKHRVTAVLDFIEGELLRLRH